jgi:hypothetical protein
MARPRTVSSKEDGNSAMTFYCPPSIKKPFKDFCKSIGTTISERLRLHMNNDLAASKDGTIKPEFDFEGKKSERRRLKKTEAELEKMLRNEMLLNHKDAYDTMVALAVFFGTDVTLTRNIEKVLVQLHHYEVGDKDPFGDSTLETFVDFLETVLKRRAIEAELKVHRRQGQDPLEIEAA